MFSHLLLNYYILQGIDQLRPNLGVQVQKSNFQTQSQFLIAAQQQQVLAHAQAQAQAQAQNNLGNSTNYGDMDPRRFSGLPRGGMNAKDGQSPMQSSSPKVTFRMSETNLMKIKISSTNS